MKAKKYFSLVTLLLVSTSCATMNESLQLGAGMGVATGAAATYSAHASTGASPAAKDVALGAGIGLGIGLLTSYITHKQVEKDREDFLGGQTEMHFGDLPPSPFVIPKIKKGK